MKFNKSIAIAVALLLSGEETNAIKLSTHHHHSYSYFFKHTDVQVNSDLNLSSDPACSSAGCTQFRFLAGASEGGHPVDYKVADHGVDKDDVITTFNSLDVAERMRGHKWVGTVPKSEAGDAAYKTDTPLDPDVVDTMAHSVLAESSKYKVKVQPKEDEDGSQALKKAEVSDKKHKQELATKAA